jgi:hypothetical protein
MHEQDRPGDVGRAARPEGRFRRLISRLTSSHEQLDAEELLADTQQVGGTPIVDCRDRERVTVSGTLRTVTLRPRAGVPALEAELYDGSGVLSVVWIGRRQVTGIEPGRALIAQGRVTEQQGRLIMFNPRYELRPQGSRE